LDGLLANKSKFSDFANSYEMKIKKYDDNSSSLLIKPKATNSFSKVMQEVKATQTNMDLKLKRDERNISNISNILNSILKLKNIKKPLMKLPNGSEVAKRMKLDTKQKIYEQYFAFDIDCKACPPISLDRITGRWMPTSKRSSEG
jgi:hypothetical protein